jgi:hypothetical protein
MEGIVAIVVGLYVLVMPQKASTWLVQLIGVYLVGNSGLAIYAELSTLGSPVLFRPTNNRFSPDSREHRPGDGSDNPRTTAVEYHRHAGIVHHAWCRPVASGDSRPR